jgi:MraZ protein
VERRISGVPWLNARLEHMFLGQYQHNIDSKGRLTIPARFREQLLNEGAYITQGFDQNLMVLAKQAFEEIYQRVNLLSMTSSKARLLKRLIFANANQVDFDRAGRILIPQYLRTAAVLDSDAMVVGVGDYIEIWSPAFWAEQIAQLQDVDANAQRFDALDISTGV